MKYELLHVFHISYFIVHISSFKNRSNLFKIRVIRFSIKRNRESLIIIPKRKHSYHLKIAPGHRSSAKYLIGFIPDIVQVRL